MLLEIFDVEVPNLTWLLPLDFDTIYLYVASSHI
jgi:hypothetical protein